jgi:hypothetical protein
MCFMDKLVEAEIIPWEPGVLGIALRFASGHSVKYAVGNLKEANEELLRMGVDSRLLRKEGHAA